MKTRCNIIFCSLLLVLLIFSLASADFTVKSKMAMSGMPMMGNMTTSTTYYITKDKFAVMTSMEGGPANVKTKSIVSDKGASMVMIDYVNQTYTVFDQSQKDKMQETMAEVEKMLDSLKESVTIEKIDIKMTGNTKKIMGINAEEMMFDAKAKIMATMMGPNPTPINLSFSGTMWGTKDFAEHKEFSEFTQGMVDSYLGMNQGGMNSFVPILTKLGIEKATIDEMMKFSTYVPLEGNMTMGIEMVMPEGAGANMPGMTMNMNMVTTAEVVSKDAIAKTEFEIPEGFKKSENMEGMGGSLPIPGFGQ